MNPSESNDQKVETFRLRAKRLTRLKDKRVKPLNICKKEVKKIYLQNSLEANQKLRFLKFYGN